MENRNLILAITLSVAILLGYEFFVAKTMPPQPAEQTTSEASPDAAPAAPVPGAPGGDVAVPMPGGAQMAPSVDQKAAASVVEKGPRVKIVSPRLHGSLALTGLRFDDLTLADYHETLDPKSPEIVVLSPRGTEFPYFAQYGWVGTAGAKVPGNDTVWAADRDTLTPETPVTLTWDNGEGLKFATTISLDNNFMFSVDQKVENTGAASASLYPYGLVSRFNTPPTTGYYILHEGMLGVIDGTLEEVKYTDVEEKAKVEKSGVGGWLGFTSKYWLTAMVPDQKEAIKARFSHHRDQTQDKYQADFLSAQPLTVAPGATVSSVNHLFSGAKEIKLLDAYEEKVGVDKFDLAIDFGWFYFLTKPIFYTLIFLHQHVGNFGIAIMLLTVVIKLLFFPLANKSYRSMSKMKLLQPKMLELREKLGDDKQRLNQEMMALYKKEGANPASGCLPMLIQIPVFFSLYKVLFVTIEMRHAPFFGWIHDLSAPDPTSIFNLFGLIPWDPSTLIPAFLNLGVWPLIMGLSMFLQQRLNPQPADPVQAKIFTFLPLVFTFMLAHFPAGLVIYWAWNNTLSMLQQWVIMKRAGTR